MKNLPLLFVALSPLAVSASAPSPWTVTLEKNAALGTVITAGYSQLAQDGLCAAMADLLERAAANDPAHGYKGSSFIGYGGANPSGSPTFSVFFTPSVPSQKCAVNIKVTPEGLHRFGANSASAAAVVAGAQARQALELLTVAGVKPSPGNAAGSREYRYGEFIVCKVPAQAEKAYCVYDLSRWGAANPLSP
jgi:hypothetical protein